MSSDEPDSRSKPSIELPPVLPPAEPAAAALRQRIRQQWILSELGVAALGRIPLQELLDSAVRMAAEGLEAEFCKVLEYLPGENRLLLRAGVGWHSGLVGVASVGADFAAPAGYAACLARDHDGARGGRLRDGRDRCDVASTAKIFVERAHDSLLDRKRRQEGVRMEQAGGSDHSSHSNSFRLEDTNRRLAGKRGRYLARGG